jgi:hypothetical protein
MRRVLAIVCVVGIAVCVVAGIGCGKKQTTNPLSNTPSVRTPFSNGAWELTYSFTATAGDSSCSDFNGAFVDTFCVAAGAVDEFFGANCSFVTVGSNFTHTCRDTIYQDDTCKVIVVLSGTGSVSGDTFTATWTLTISGVGDCSGLFFPDCTIRITGTGKKVAAACTSPVFMSMPEALEHATKARLVERLQVRRR